MKTAGVTTGAFYGYYKSKEELFDALAGVQYETVMERFIEAQEEFAKLPPENQHDSMGSISGSCMEWMTQYIYENLLEFKLILSCSEGTKYENMIHKMVEIEVGATQNLLKIWRDSAIPNIMLTLILNICFAAVSLRIST